RRLAHEEGLFVGPSSGAALAGAIRVANGIDSGMVVAIFPDGGDRYLSDQLWDVAIEEDAIVSDAPVHLRLDETQMTVIRRHGARTYPDECCGALLGPKPGEVALAHPLDNTFPDGRRRRFL